MRYPRLLGERPTRSPAGAPAGGRHADLERWARLLEPGGARPAAAFAYNRAGEAGFVAAAALRRRLGQPAPDPKRLWPAPQLPGFEGIGPG